MLFILLSNYYSNYRILYKGLSQILKNSPASPTVQSESLLSFRGGKERQRLHLTLENSDSVEDHLYDTYGDSSLIEMNPMLEKKKNLLSPLKKRV
jgi:hypothetical protein